MRLSLGFYVAVTTSFDSVISSDLFDHFKNLYRNFIFIFVVQVILLPFFFFNVGDFTWMDWGYLKVTFLITDCSFQLLSGMCSLAQNDSKTFGRFMFDRY